MKKTISLWIAVLLIVLAGCGARAEQAAADAGAVQGIQTCGGYTLEPVSTVCEGGAAYATFLLTAPEDVDLRPVLDVSTEERLSFPGVQAVPEGSSMNADVSAEVADSADGKANTVHVVLCIRPMMVQGEASPFGSGKRCTVTFRDIVHWGFDRDYDRELRETKYAGQSHYTPSPEESGRLHPQTLLASGEWTFEIELTAQAPQTVELLTQPVTAKALVMRTGPNGADPVDCVEDVTFTAIRLTALALTADFEPPQQPFDSLFLNMREFGNGNYGDVLVQLRSGECIRFFQYDGAVRTATLRADKPIDLSQADRLILADGTEIPLP